MKEKAGRTALNVVGAVLLVSFIPVIILNLLLIVNSYQHPDDIPGAFGIKPVIVLSGSMEPAIKTGDLIFLHKAEPSELKEGDVICYLTSGKAVTHRIIEVTVSEDGGIGFITQGDANNVEDRLVVKTDQIQGIWNGGRIGGVGKMMMSMQSPVGLMAAILCPVLLLLFFEIWLKRREDREELLRGEQERAKLEAELEAMKQKLAGGPDMEENGMHQSHSSGTGSSEIV